MYAGHATDSSYMNANLNYYYPSASSYYISHPVFPSYSIESQRNILSLDFHIKTNNIQKAIETIPKDLNSQPEHIQHEYLIIITKSKNFNLIKKALEKIQPDVQSSIGHSVLFERSIGAEYNQVSKLLIESGANPDPSEQDTLHFPIINTVKIVNNINKEFLIHLINRDVDLLVSDKNNYTVIMYLAKSNEPNLIKFYFGRIKSKYSKPEYIKYLNKKNNFNQTTLEILAQYDKFSEMKYLLSEGAELPCKNRIIETKYDYKKIIYITPTDYVLISHEMNLNEFYNKISKMTTSCMEWKSYLTMRNIVKIYHLTYNQSDIIKSISDCCATNFSHDIDSISFICKSYQEEKAAKLIQKWYNIIKDKTQSPEKDAVKIIQKYWRRKKNNTYLQENFCGICFNILSEKRSCELLPDCFNILSKERSCKLLPDCKHFYHSTCINTWRAHKNTCPACRKTIVTPPINT